MTQKYRNPQFCDLCYMYILCVTASNISVGAAMRYCMFSLIIHESTACTVCVVSSVQLRWQLRQHEDGPGCRGPDHGASGGPWRWRRRPRRPRWQWQDQRHGGSGPRETKGLQRKTGTRGRVRSCPTPCPTPWAWLLANTLCDFILVSASDVE